LSAVTATTALETASPIAEPRLRLNVVCPYYTMFPLSFPLRALADSGPGEWVLDPFCGRGTTAYAARLLGLPTAGVDADAMAVAVARAKLLKRTPEQVEARCNELLDRVTDAAEIPAAEFWSMAFHPTTLREICRMREALLRVDTEDDVLLRAIVLGILHGPQSVHAPSYLSNQMPRTYATKPSPAMAYWKRKGLKPQRVDLRDAVARRARYILKSVPDTVMGGIVKGDAREITALGLPKQFDHVVTSPPYLGMRTYRPDQWLRHWFLGGPAQVDYAMGEMLRPSPTELFAAELGKVWAGVAKICRPGATLTVRFGTLPSVPGDPEQIFRASLEVSRASWRIASVTSAGRSSFGKRQAGQMGRCGDAVEEIDVRAQLVD
jgi:hypothetical protein